MQSAKRWVGFAALIAALASGACGGGNGSTPAPLTKEAFIAQADKLCADANEELDALGEPQSIEELGNLLRTGATRTRKLLADLRALPAPTQDRGALEQIYSLVEQAIAKLEQAIATTAAGDQAKIQTLVEAGQDLTDQANAASKSYGFKDCAE